jgi:REP element-mobilizing transposase RayT
MPYRKFTFALGEHYHLYNRGNNYEDVFRNEEDYVLFLRLLRKYLVSNGTIALLAYCLMPNHYHLLGLLQRDDLSSCMQAMMLAYTKTINHKYQRVGALFQGRFKAIRVGAQAHLDLLADYIHLNPVDAGFVHRAEEWPYSSYLDLVGLRKGTLVAKGGHPCDLEPLSKEKKELIGDLTLEK